MKANAMTQHKESSRSKKKNTKVEDKISHLNNERQGMGRTEQSVTHFDEQNDGATANINK